MLRVDGEMHAVGGEEVLRPADTAALVASLLSGDDGQELDQRQGGVHHVNRRRRCHTLTIEDPIGYVHDHALGAVNLSSSSASG